MIVWGNKKYIIDKLIKNNGFENIKKKLSDLLYGSKSLETRWDYFIKNVKGLGASTVSELLCYVHPKECVVFNRLTILCYQYLGISGMPRYNYQFTGKKYVEACNYGKEIAKKLKEANAKEYDLLTVDWQVLCNTETFLII